jgi:leader peptidase (prepilin peptidase)/N-methyltransferase
MPAFSGSFPPVLILICIAALGLIFGSFVTALSYRLPRGISIAKGRSACPACGATLMARDLIPVVSWLMHRGACRACRTKISWRYPAIEVAMSALFVIAALTIENSIRLALVLGATPVMVTLAVIDIEHRRLPNVLLATFAGFATALRYVDDGDYLTAVLSAVIVFALAVALDSAGRRLIRQGLGMGDAKLMAIGAMAFSPLPLTLVFCAAGVLGVFTGLVWRRDSNDPRHFPFGPALLAAFWIGLVGF